MPVKKPKIAIVSINKFKYSETFIQAHVKRLPFDILYLHTRYLPTRYGMNDMPVALLHRLHDEEAVYEGLEKLLLKENVELVLAEYGPSGVKMKDLCYRLGIPLIVYFRGYDAYRKDVMALYGHEYPDLFQKASAIFAVSKQMQKHLISMGAPVEKIHYNPSGADERLFGYHNPAENPPVFLFVGRFEDTKAPHITILAFAETVRVVPEARLIMIGDGYLMLSCKALVKALGLTGIVEFKGVLPHQMIPEYMQNARALVHHAVQTSSNDREGTPVAIMEASLSGLPVIATKHGGIPEVIHHGKTGLLVDEYDYRTMAEYMIQVAKNPGYAQQLGNAGHAFIKTYFTTGHNIQRLSSVISQIIGQKDSILYPGPERLNHPEKKREP